MARVLVVGGLASSLVRFRGPLLGALRRRGHEVLAAAPEPWSEAAAPLAAWGVETVSIPLQRAGMNPLADLGTLLALRRLVRRRRPDVLFAYTIKPILYGLLAARARAGTRAFALVTGLGYAFVNPGPRARAARFLVRRLYRLALRRAERVFFQNPDDRDLFLRLGLVRPADRAAVVAGSGIDLDEFPAVSPPEGPPVFLLIARLLGDKGIREYAAAAAALRARYPAARFRLAGPFDVNPAAIARCELDAWVRSGAIEYLGELADVRPALRAASVYVLPSYREGLPRTVLEAMATGRAVVTSDAPGCRETVVEGENGFLVPVGDAATLAATLERFLRDPGLAARLGRASRSLAERRFDVRAVNAELLAAMGL